MDDIKEGWEQMRMQTFYLIDIQLDKKDKMDYSSFKRQFMPMAWDEFPEIEVPIIDWEEKDRRDRERTQNANKTEILKF